MTAFNFKGYFQGYPSEGRVEDGKITGDVALAIYVEVLVKNRMLVAEGPFSGTANLEDDLMARVTLQAVMDEVTFDPPLEPQPVPEDVES